MEREELYFQPEIECAEPEVLREIQSERLRSMVARCYQHVPFYRRKLDEMGIRPEDIQSIDDIVKLPFTYKTDLRVSFSVWPGCGAEGRGGACTRFFGNNGQTDRGGVYAA